MSMDVSTAYQVCMFKQNQGKEDNNAPNRLVGCLSGTVLRWCRNNNSSQRKCRRSHSFTCINTCHNRSIWIMSWLHRAWKYWPRSGRSCRNPCGTGKYTGWAPSKVVPVDPHCSPYSSSQLDLAGPANRGQDTHQGHLANRTQQGVLVTHVSQHTHSIHPKAPMKWLPGCDFILYAHIFPSESGIQSDVLSCLTANCIRDTPWQVQNIMKTHVCV